MSSDARRIQAYYATHPEMVASPFTYRGDLDRALLATVWQRLNFTIKHKIMLDVGCGKGLLKSYCEEQGATYFGTDLTPAALPVQLTNQEGRFGVANATQLPFADHSLDAVVCIDVFEHIPQQAQAAREFRRVLRPHGEVFLSVPNYCNVAGLIKICAERLNWTAPNTWAPFGGWATQELEHLMTPARVQKVFQNTGRIEARLLAWEQELLIGIFPWFWRWRWLQRIHWRLITLSALQPFYRAVTTVLPTLSLHHFWRIRMID